MGFLDIDSPPEGFQRSNPGWLKRKATPHSKMIGDLKNENLELRSKLAELEEAVSSLLLKKSKK